MSGLKDVKAVKELELEFLDILVITLLKAVSDPV